MTRVFGSLFAGIGGIDLGLERAGWTCAWQVEKDPYCRAVLARHWPDVPRYGDVRKVDPHELPPVDAVVGGFPCQPVSLTGRRLAQADPRWLWPEFRRIIEGVGPQLVLIENVLGLRTAGLRDVLADLAALGFNAEWSPLTACQVGAPHTRARLFIVAHADPLGRLPSSGLRPSRESRERRSGPDNGGSDGDRPAWPAEPIVVRMAHGFPDGVVRVAALGNAVVPAVAELVGSMLGGDSAVVG